jgi:thioesterase domain-containing protein/aryl carrier-like protein
VVLHEREGSKSLAAYVVVRGGLASDLAAAELKSWAKSRLPEYMVPATITVLDALPLTPNGKVDRRALPEPDLFVSAGRYMAPRTATELHLTRVWQDVLAVRPISIDDNFFDLGGHSLLAIRLMARIEQHFGQRLALATLFQSPTIAQQAQRLSTPLDNSALPPHVVPIQTEGTRRAMYVLPGAGGEVLYYHLLGAHLGRDQPVYGLQSPGIDDGEEPAASVRAHATTLVQSLRAHQPEGPYRLLGHSSGGRVAFEMAQQLELQGQRVEHLVILDSTPQSDPIELQKSLCRSSLDKLLDAIGTLEGTVGQSLDLSREALEALPDEQARWTLFAQRLWQRDVLPSSVSVERIRALFQIWERAGDNHLRYQPAGQLKASIQLVRAQEQWDSNDTPAALDWDWQPYATEPVKTHWVPGNHSTMLNAPHVQTLAQLLHGLLAGDS